MADIAHKSTGMLIDELITNAFKAAFAHAEHRPTSEFDKRYELLRAAIALRFAGVDVAHPVHLAAGVAFLHSKEPLHPDPSFPMQPVEKAMFDLCSISLATWRAQEVVMRESDDAVVAAAAREAQHCNAKRTAAIREIDRILDEADITITTKTYG